MTDKDIKDYCKSCDVEPPAMKFKCPVCKHNPDKEQIVIDGIACKNYNNGTCQEGYCSGSVANIISCDPRNIRCDFYIDRIEEQLARKTQECEEHRRNAESYCKSYQYSCAVNGKITDLALKYKQALDEIESICLEDVHTFADGTKLRYDSLDEILNIINKAKEKE